MMEGTQENPCAFDNRDGQRITLIDRSNVLSDHDFRMYWKTLYYGPYLVHIDREGMRRGLWKKYDAVDQARQIKIKGDRVMHTFETGDVPGDVALEQLVKAELDDIVNYAVFTKRILNGQV